MTGIWLPEAQQALQLAGKDSHKDELKRQHAEQL